MGIVSVDPDSPILLGEDSTIRTIDDQAGMKVRKSQAPYEGLKERKFGAKLGTASESETKGKKTDRKYLKVVEKDEEYIPANFSLDGIRKSLPPEVFIKSLRRSVQWMFWDMVVWATALFLLRGVYRWETDASLQQMCCKIVCMFALYWVCGFFMWGTFVVGHDCGHGTFSDHREVNFLCGLFTHGSILVPFTPWARSHRMHHLNHNHVEKDYSFPWSHDPEYDQPSALDAYPRTAAFISAAVYPFFGYFWYLLVPQKLNGIDGSHYLPLPGFGCRLWDNVDWDELFRSWVSVAGCLTYLSFYITYCFASISEFCALYFPSWIMFCFFLYTVTYLQHHSQDTKLYDDTTWRYGLAAFETVDRTYGKWIDVLHHHISDCHVVHHLFFTKIPHYNLGKATEAMVAYLQANNLGHIYQYDTTLDFHTRVFKYMYAFQTRAKLITKNDM